MAKDYLTVKEAAAEMNMGVSTLYRYIEEGLIGYFQVRRGAAIRITRVQIQKFKETHKSSEVPE